MKITKEELRRIIKEELEAELKQEGVLGDLGRGAASLARKAAPYALAGATALGAGRANAQSPQQGQTITVAQKNMLIRNMQLTFPGDYAVKMAGPTLQKAGVKQEFLGRNNIQNTFQNILIAADMSKNPQISGILGQLGSQYEQAVRRGSGRTVEGASESATVIIKYMEEFGDELVKAALSGPGAIYASYLTQGGR